MSTLTKKWQGKASMRVTLQTKLVTRQRIVDASKKLFARQGFDATTTRDIAAAAQIAVGTLFNYFPTKESIVECLVSDACDRAAQDFASSFSCASSDGRERADEASLEEELFGHAAGILRKLKPYRKYLSAILETAISPLAANEVFQVEPSLRVAHLEMVSQIVSKHGQQERLSATALQLYWTLWTGVLAFWAKDRSPRQEDTLALLDQSLAMFAGWLTAPLD